MLKNFNLSPLKHLCSLAVLNLLLLRNLWTRRHSMIAKVVIRFMQTCEQTSSIYSRSVTHYLRKSDDRQYPQLAKQHLSPWSHTDVTSVAHLLHWCCCLLYLFLCHTLMWQACVSPTLARLTAAWRNGAFMESLPSFNWIRPVIWLHLCIR